MFPIGLARHQKFFGPPLVYERPPKVFFDWYHLKGFEAVTFDLWNLRGIRLWSKIGSEAEVTSPEQATAGTTGQVVSPFTDHFVSAVYGNGLRHPAKADIDYGTECPSWYTTTGQFPDTEGSMECWVYFPGTPDEDSGILAIHSLNIPDDTTDYAEYRARLRVYVTTAGLIRFESQTVTTLADDSETVATKLLASVDANELTGWHHLACVWNQFGIAESADTARIYLDGVDSGSDTEAFDFDVRVAGGDDLCYIVAWPSINDADNDKWRALQAGVAYGGDWPDAIIDNLVVWAGERTSFGDRYRETPEYFAGDPAFAFDQWNVGALTYKTPFDRYDLRGLLAKIPFDQWHMQKAAEMLAFDAWHIAGELVRTGFDQWHIFTAASAKLKTLYDQYHLYNAARKTVCDLYNILGEVLKVAFDRYKIEEGRPFYTYVFDLYRIYQTAGYLIFSNAGDGGTVDWSNSVGFTTSTTWGTSSISTGSLYRFGVRARNELFTEQNTHVAAKLDIDASGADVTSRPNAIRSLKATAIADGKVRLTWTYRHSTGAATVTHFHVYQGVDATSLAVAASVLKASGDFTHYRWTSGALTEGATYSFRVKAATASDVEDTGTKTVTAVPDATPPGEFENVLYRVT